MSRFFSEAFKKLVPYTPGEQPQNRMYIKLNTNESPYPPSPKAQEYAEAQAKTLALYPDPACRRLREALGVHLGVSPDRVILGNGSDEILHFIFTAFCDKTHPAVFPDITYGFYKVFAALSGVPYETIALKNDFSIDINAYCHVGKTVFLANPNAPTGLILKRSDIEKIVRTNPDNVVVVDEAYVDFGAESAVSLTERYDNLLVVQTFSKSRSMAGARLGFAVGGEALIRDLDTIRYSTNPYNVNAMTMASALGSLEDDFYTRENCQKIIETRAYTSGALANLGFFVLPSSANFVFAKHDVLTGQAVYEALKERGILVRHFCEPSRIADYNRITVGTMEQMQTLVKVLKQILEEKQ